MTDRVQTAPCFVCRCEEIAAADVERAIAAGAATINDVKRRTKAGMGLCQGIFCVPAISAMIVAAAEARGETAALPAIEPMTARPPVRPIPLASLADLVADDEG